MLAKDYFERCLEDDEKIIKLFFSFLVEITKPDYLNIERRYCPYFENNIITKRRQIVKSYFLEFVLKFNADIKELFKKHNLNFELSYADNQVQKTIDSIYNNVYEVSYSRYYDYQSEVIFSYSNFFATSLIKTYSEYDRPICVERILLNMIRDNLFDFIDLTCLIDDLEELASKKEGTRKILSNRNNSQVKIPYGTLLTQKHYEYNPLIGRKKEFRQMCALINDEEKSVIIHGATGVGKTTLVKGLAYQIQEGTAPIPFRDKEILEVSGSDMVSGCKFVGMLEERMQKIIDFVLNNPNVILFVDEIHTLMGLGRGENSNNDVSNILKPYLGDGRIKIIGATTTDEYSIINENSAFGRRFNGILIPEPKDVEILEILEKTIERYQAKKGITIPYDEETTRALLNLIIAFSKRKMSNVKLGKGLNNPDLALTILRSGYNYTILDGEDTLNVVSLIEGLDSMDYFGEAAKEEFEQKAMSLTRKLTFL